MPTPTISNKYLIILYYILLYFIILLLFIRDRWPTPKRHVWEMVFPAFKICQNMTGCKNHTMFTPTHFNLIENQITFKHFEFFFNNLWFIYIKQTMTYNRIIEKGNCVCIMTIVCIDFWFPLSKTWSGSWNDDAREIDFSHIGEGIYKRGILWVYMLNFLDPLT